jgi:hypothetical protein
MTTPVMDGAGVSDWDQAPFTTRSTMRKTCIVEVNVRLYRSNLRII